MLIDVCCASITYDLTLGMGMILVDATLTYFVVDRVIERQDERKRRRLSGLAEARLLEAADGLLADGMPLTARRLDARAVTVGDTVVPVQVRAVDLDAVTGEMGGTLAALSGAFERYGNAITNPLNASVIEPRLWEMVVVLITSLESCRNLLPGWQSAPSSEVLPEIDETVPRLFGAAWKLSTAIQERWP